MKIIIYKSTNIKNGKSYIGKTVKGLKRRMYEHHTSSNSGSNSAFHSALRKYGHDSFEWSIIETTNVENINELEIYYIKNLNTLVPNGYNLTYGGDGAPIGELNPAKRPEVREVLGKVWLGRKHSEKSKKKMSKSLKGRKLSEETKSKISNAQIGHTRNGLGSKNKISKKYIIIFPDGKEEIIHGLRDFTRKHKIGRKGLFLIRDTENTFKGFKIKSYE
jgi:group I intron endonuclease